jgi:putative transposase
MSAADLCRKHGTSDVTFILLAQEIWRDGGVRGQTAEGLGRKNAKLKKLLAEQMKHVATLREMLSKNF